MVENMNAAVQIKTLNLHLATLADPQAKDEAKCRFSVLICTAAFMFSTMLNFLSV